MAPLAVPFFLLHLSHPGLQHLHFNAAIQHQAKLAFNKFMHWRYIT
jgi:hypothetical protein